MNIFALVWNLFLIIKDERLNNLLQQKITGTILVISWNKDKSNVVFTSFLTLPIDFFQIRKFCAPSGEKPERERKNT